MSAKQMVESTGKKNIKIKYCFKDNYKDWHRLKHIYWHMPITIFLIISHIYKNKML